MLENAKNVESWREGRPCSLNRETCLIPLKGKTHPSLLLKTRLGFQEPTLSARPAGKHSASPTVASLPGRIGGTRCEPLGSKGTWRLIADCSTSVFRGKAAAAKPPQVGMGREPGSLNSAESIWGASAICVSPACSV